MRPTGETGVQTHFNGFLRTLERRNVLATCITPFSSPRALIYPVFGMRRLVDPVSGSLSVWWYRRWHGRFLRYALARELKRERGPVVVYAQCPVSASAALKARRSGDQRVVMVVHFNESQADEWADKGRLGRRGFLYRRIRAFEEAVLPRLDGIVYVSDFMRRELEARIPELRSVRSSVIPNFVDLPARREVVTTRGDLVSVGTLEPRKNQAYLLDILSAAAQMGRRYTLDVVGDGPDRPALERRARELGIAEHVRFLGFRTDASEFVSGHRLFCHTARQENFPISVLEAMAHGISVAASPVGGIPEMFRDGVEGVFWPLDAPFEAAEILVRHLENRAALASAGTAARERVAEHFTSDIVGERLGDFLFDASF